MNKRHFLSQSMAMVLGAAGVTGVAGLASAGTKAASAPSEREIVLTITGGIAKTNRASFDPMTDQLMYKHGIKFDSAFTFSLQELLAMPSVTIHPTMEYDAKPHALRGPRLMDVLEKAGLIVKPGGSLLLHAIDGYSPELKLQQAQKTNYIIATHFDGKQMPIGGFGPLFLIYDADQYTEAKQKSLQERFAGCPWGLYCIEVA